MKLLKCDNLEQFHQTRLKDGYLVYYLVSTLVNHVGKASVRLSFCLIAKRFESYTVRTHVCLDKKLNELKTQWRICHEVVKKNTLLHQGLAQSLA